MDRNEIYNQVKQIILDKIEGIEESKITMEASFLNDLKIDSFDIFDLVESIEEQFGVEISDEAGRSFYTVKDVVDFIEKNN